VPLATKMHTLMARRHKIRRWDVGAAGIWVRWTRGATAVRRAGTASPRAGGRSAPHSSRPAGKPFSMATRCVLCQLLGSYSHTWLRMAPEIAGRREQDHPATGAQLPNRHGDAVEDTAIEDATELPAPDDAFRVAGVASTLRQIGPYIAAHRGSTVVVHIPGECLESELFQSLSDDIVLLHTLGLKLVLVVGCRPQIERRLFASGVDLGFQEWRDNVAHRITDEFVLQQVVESWGWCRVQMQSHIGRGLVTGSEVKRLGLQVRAPRHRRRQVASCPLLPTPPPPPPPSTRGGIRPLSVLFPIAGRAVEEVCR
jgi:hypothetical protein